MGNTPTAHTIATEAFTAAMSHALTGDMGTALPLLRTLDAQALDARDRAALVRVLDSFDTGTAGESRPDVDAWTARVMDAYQGYWSRVMQGVVMAGEGSQQLAVTLAALVGITGRDAEQADMDSIEPVLKERIRSKGCFSLHGVTKPFRELMLWRTQQEREFEVDLPDGRVAVPVVMLADFLSLGWVGFATGNRYHCGGWATRERLYCVRPSYDPDSETFRVSYLAHEAQHFSDYERFPALEGPELEYRAKLVELVLADTSLGTLLGNFGTNGSEHRTNPHGFANRRLTCDLVRILEVTDPVGPWWQAVLPTAIRAAARDLLGSDTRRLERDHGHQE